MLDSIEQTLLAEVHALRDDLIQFCSRLLQTPSVNGVHPERALAEVLAAQAQMLGLDAQIIGAQADRPNVIINTTPAEPTGLLLLGHLDTVPTGDAAAWSQPPFGGVVAAGRLYGRGAIDTKGGMTAALYALALLKRVPGALPAGNVQFIGVPDEESGATGTLGIKWLYEYGLLHAKGAIYAYSGREITLGHRGLLRYQLICHGQAIHTGAEQWQQGTAGANAVTALADLLVTLEALPFPQSTTPYFESFRTVITPGTMIQGGTSINIVPDRCEAWVDIRLTPETPRQHIETLLDEVMRRIETRRPRIRFEIVNLNDAAAAMTSVDSVVVQVLEGVMRDLGSEPQRVVAGPANEGYLLVERGIPTICGFGPLGANAHAVDEYVEVESLVETAALFAIVGRRMAAATTA
jgi:acetylornithine deacetylase/succinyl-diaminopimelate desuccinylase-like protein